jgi:acetyltransferase
MTAFEGQIPMTETAVYPSELEADIVLANRRIRIRALRQFEEESFHDLFNHLSSRTRYLRFLSRMPTLPDSLARTLARVDYRRQLALVAEHDNPIGTEILGLASFGALDDSRVEVGLVIRDDWQRQRLGTELADRILGAAEARGFHQFVANSSSDNIAIQKLLRRLGRIVSTKMSGGMSELTFVRCRTK